MDKIASRFYYRRLCRRRFAIIVRGGLTAGGFGRLHWSRGRRSKAVMGSAKIMTDARKKSSRQQRMGRRCSACWIEPIRSKKLTAETQRTQRIISSLLRASSAASATLRWKKRLQNYADMD
jgi:hypothetical protein